MKYSDFDKLIEDFASVACDLYEKKNAGSLTENDREAYRAAKVALKQAYDRIFRAAYISGKNYDPRYGAY